MRNLPPDELLRLMCGVTSVTDFAATHGVSVDEATALRTDALARFSTAMAPRPPRWKLRVAGLALLVLLPATAIAQLRSFTANNPAIAADVNFNFNQLKTWLEAKVGVAGTAGVQAASVAVAGSTTTATLNVGTTSTLAGTANLTGTGNLSGTTNITSTGTLAVAGNFNVNTDTPTGTWQMGTVKAFRTNEVTLRVKTSNNGTVNCDVFCNDSTRESWSGSCLGTKLVSSGHFTPDCGWVPSSPVRCLCASY